MKAILHNGHMNARYGRTGTSGVWNGVKIYERDWIEDFIQKITPTLQNNGIEVRYHDGESIYSSGGEQCDLFLAIHCDGSTNQAYRGWLIDGQEGNWTSSQIKFRNLFLENYKPPIPHSQSHANPNTAFYYGYYHISSPAKILVEYGTMTNSNDIAYLMTQKNYAVSQTTKTIFEYFNISNMPNLEELQNQISELEAQVNSLKSEIEVHAKEKVFWKYLGRPLSDTEKLDGIDLPESRWEEIVQGSSEQRALIDRLFENFLGRNLNGEQEFDLHKFRPLSSLIFVIMGSEEFRQRVGSSNSEEVLRLKNELTRIRDIAQSNLDG